MKRSFLKRKPLKRKPKPPLSEEEKEAIQMMWNVFLRIWRKRPHISEVSGDKIFSPPSSANFHHIFKKETYPQHKYDEDNIIVLTIDEHTNVESNKFRYEEINRRREILKKKYNIK